MTWELKMGVVRQISKKPDVQLLTLAGTPHLRHKTGPFWKGMEVSTKRSGMTPILPKSVALLLEEDLLKHRALYHQNQENNRDPQS